MSSFGLRATSSFSPDVATMENTSPGSHSSDRFCSAARAQQQPRHKSADQAPQRRPQAWHFSVALSQPYLRRQRSACTRRQGRPRSHARTSTADREHRRYSWSPPYRSVPPPRGNLGHPQPYPPASTERDRDGLIPGGG
eukprot:scaffold1449_cov324-Prasinococcus_capsulatus_cf.AAC.6